ncbi:MAG: type II toxin-antitoxin system RelE/ParE family toxin [Desulfofustis sp. PB-SRB1]|nr:type II toxin-antitoxin system RelE/ParE family toxin [Desulfofustis sp. PB-SRB1]MBM1003757.1 type II toxin-antitoxin system RelE/ParE family toxin [Desulfofustis sp. PB-SRB1]HBH31075.1 type II toxin-antitoxin system RelE/ParE family toxin [Desulfofustis sp.]
MAWTIKYTKTFQKEIRKLDRPIQNKVKSFFDELVTTGNPRGKGKPLTQNLSGLWRYRIEDFRIVCAIQEDELLVLVLRIGHRSKIYRKNTLTR